MKKSKRVAAITLAVALVVGIFAGVSAWAAQRVSPVEIRTGVTVYSNNKASIDASNLAEGFLLIKYTGTSTSRIRVQISKDNGVAYTYDINNAGRVETFPLTEGNGNYTVRVLENTGGTRYAIAYSTTVNLTLRDPLVPYLYSNQYVNFTKDSAVAKKAAELVAGKTTDVEKLTAIYNYVIDNFTYDYAKAATVQTGYLPAVDTILAAKKGICFDYAAVMTAMLRSQNIPCKLVIGYADTVYHAWVNVFVDGNWVEGAIYFQGDKWSLLDPTYMSSGGRSDSVRQFVGNTQNYTQKYAY